MATGIIDVESAQYSRALHTLLAHEIKRQLELSLRDRIKPMVDELIYGAVEEAAKNMESHIRAQVDRMGMGYVADVIVKLNGKALEK